MSVLDENAVAKAILEKGLDDLMKVAESDVIIAGAGPAGLTAAMYLAKGGAKVTVLEKKLSFGGGMGGGGMLLPRMVVERKAADILREVGCRLEEIPGGYVAKVPEMIAKLACGALDAGANLLLGVSVVDVVYREDRIAGVVLQWTAVEAAGLHVDPLSFRCRAVVDCTGHDAEVLRIACRKVPWIRKQISQLPGEGAMWVEMGEKEVVEKTGEIFRGLYAAGMSVAAFYGTPRMGPIFGGMLLSGKKVAEVILEHLKSGRI